MAFICWVAARFSSNLWPDLLSHHGHNPATASFWFIGGLILGLSLLALGISWLIMPFRDDEYLVGFILAPFSLAVTSLGALAIQSIWIQLTNNASNGTGSWFVHIIENYSSNSTYVARSLHNGFLALLVLILMFALFAACWFLFVYYIDKFVNAAQTPLVPAGILLAAAAGGMISGQFMYWLLYMAPGHKPWLFSILSTIAWQ